MLGHNHGASSAHGSVGVFRGIDDRNTDADDAFLGMVRYTRAELHAGAMNWRLLTPLSSFISTSRTHDT